MNATERTRLGKITLMIVFGTVLVNAWYHNSFEKLCSIVNKTHTSCNYASQVNANTTSMNLYDTDAFTKKFDCKRKRHENKADHCKRKPRRPHGHEGWTIYAPSTPVDVPNVSEPIEEVAPIPSIAPSPIVIEIR